MRKKPESPVHVNNVGQRRRETRAGTGKLQTCLSFARWTLILSTDDQLQYSQCCCSLANGAELLRRCSKLFNITCRQLSLS